MEEQIFVLTCVNKSKTLVRQSLDRTFSHVVHFLYNLCGRVQAFAPAPVANGRLYRASDIWQRGKRCLGGLLGRPRRDGYAYCAPVQGTLHQKVDDGMPAEPEICDRTAFRLAVPKTAETT